MKDYKYISTITGRSTSAQPNIEEVERAPKLGRPLFIPDPKPLLIEVDFSIYDIEPNIKRTIP